MGIKRTASIAVHLSSAVANGSTFTVPYPEGTSAINFEFDNTAEAVINQATKSLPAAFGASAITVTNNTGATIAPTDVKNLSIGYVESKADASKADGAGADGRVAKFAIDSNGNVAGLVGPDGSSIIAILNEDKKPIVCIGSDHPYLQLWGTDGSDGMFAAYKNNGLPTYNAICWDKEQHSSGNWGATFSDFSFDPDNFLSLAQARSLQAQGLEFVAHGTRHPSEWDRLNTGIRIDYLGAAASATVKIDGNGKVATQVIFVGNGGGENTTLLLSSYPTIESLRVAINALAGGASWRMRYAQELEGTEPSKFLWPIAAARTVTGGGAPYNNRRFCLSGGVRGIYLGSTYRTVELDVFTAGDLKIYVDGVKAASYSPTTQTITSLVSDITNDLLSFGVSDIYITMMDNATPTAGRETYLQGDELATYLPRTRQSLMGRPALLTYGLPLQYVVKKQFETLNSRAAAEGIVLKNMAQAGTSLRTDMIFDLPYGESRLDAVSFGLGVINPYAMPANLDVPWHTVSTVSSARTLAEFKAAIDAVCDSGPFAVDFLIHKVQADGSSGYSFPTNDLLYYDMVESDFVAGITYLGEKQRSGLVDVRAPEQFRKERRLRKTPSNLIFNPRFLNREVHGGAALLGAAASFGWAVSGWYSNFPSGAGGFSSVSVQAGVLTLVTDGALSADVVVLRQNLWMARGTVYDIGAYVDASLMTAGTVSSVIRADRLRPAGMPVPLSGNARYVVGRPAHPYTNYKTNLTFSKDGIQEWSGERVMSRVGPFNLGASPSHLSVNYMNIGLVTDINISGAAPSATTAKEIAAAINAAVAASAAYTNYPELHTAAKAEAGRLVLEVPYRNTQPSSVGCHVANGTTNGQATLIFGSSIIESHGTEAGAMNAGVASYAYELLLPAGTNGTIKISSPYCIEVTSA